MSRTRKRGAIRTGLLVLGTLLLILLATGGCAVGRYNAIVAEQETVNKAFSQIDNQYKRRFDLIPQLVETVKGAANFEKSVLTDVTEARASVGRVQMPASATSDPKAVEQYLEAQQGLGAAVGRLLMTSERYPELKATASFRDLQSQVEGTENRIAVARTDYIEAVQSFNTTLRKFPGNLVAGFMGVEHMPQLEAASAGEREVPKIDFSGN